MGKPLKVVREGRGFAFPFWLPAASSNVFRKLGVRDRRSAELATSQRRGLQPGNRRGTWRRRIPLP